MKRRLAYILFLCLVPHLSMAQDIQYARAVVDSLTSERMYGRGYVNKGDSVAAAYIAGEFSLLGLRPLGERYLQHFKININTFPGKAEVKINNQPVMAGKDFHIHPCSPGISGTFRIKKLSIDDTQEAEELLEEIQDKKARNRIILLDKTELDKDDAKEKTNYEAAKNYIQNAVAIPPVAIVELTKEKLTWSVRTEACQRPLILINKDSIPEKKIKKISIDIESEYIEGYQTQNVVGFIRGHKYPDSFIVFTAHYDHLGMMGNKVYFPGANDDASGVAMLLNLAKYYSNPHIRPEYSIAFIAFAAEEAGLLGSEYFVNYPALPLDNIKFLINTDMVGTGEEGITVVNATQFPEHFDKLVNINNQKQYLKAVNPRGKARNSDHYYFTERDVPSFFIYTQGGVAHYHDILDRPETLMLPEFEDLMLLLIDFVATM